MIYLLKLDNIGFVPLFLMHFHLVIILIGYMNEGQHTQGCVFILYSVNDKLNVRSSISAMDLDEIYDLKLCSPNGDIYSRFGFALATSSNDEGNYEIYIGAPAYGMNNLTYQGIVYYYESYIDENDRVAFKVKCGSCLFFRGSICKTEI